MAEDDGVRGAMEQRTDLSRIPGGRARPAPSTGDDLSERSFIKQLPFVLDQLRSEGYPVLPDDAARLSPFGYEHINMLGRYSFVVPDAVARGELRSLRAGNDPGGR
jgi:hypothetical protein